MVVWISIIAKKENKLLPTNKFIPDVTEELWSSVNAIAIFNIRFIDEAKMKIKSIIHVSKYNHGYDMNQKFEMNLFPIH